MKNIHPLWQASLLMVALSLMTSFVSVLSRLADGTLHPFQLVFFMMVIGLIAQLHLATFRKKSPTFKRQPHKLYITRSIFEIIGFSCSFFAVKYLPLPVFSALAYLTPLFISTAAVLILKESTTKHTWIALFCGIVGMLIIIRPSGEIELLGPILMIIMGISFSITSVTIKVLIKTESLHDIIFFMFFYTTLLTTPLALYYWMPSLMDGIFIISSLGLISFLQQHSVSIAFSKAPVSFLMPITFVTLIFTSIQAHIFFDEQLDLYTLVGAVVILSSACYSTIRNGHHARKNT